MKKFIPVYASDTTELAELLTRYTNDSEKDGWTYECFEKIRVEKTAFILTDDQGQKRRQTEIEGILVFNK